MPSFFKKMASFFSNTPSDTDNEAKKSQHQLDQQANSMQHTIKVIKELVADTKLHEALNLLIQCGNQEAIELRNRLLALDIPPLKPAQDITTLRNTIARAILWLVDEAEESASFVFDKKETEKIGMGENEANNIAPVEPLDPADAIVKLDKAVIRELVSQWKIKNVLDLIKDAGYFKADYWDTMYKKSNRLNNLGMINQVDFYAQQRQLCTDILSAKYLEGETAPKMLSIEDKIRIKNLLDQDEIEEILIAYQEDDDTLTILSGFYIQIRYDCHRQLLTKQNYQAYLNWIKFSIAQHLLG